MQQHSAITLGRCEKGMGYLPRPHCALRPRTANLPGLEHGLETCGNVVIFAKAFAILVILQNPDIPRCASSRHVDLCRFLR